MFHPKFQGDSKDRQSRCVVNGTCVCRLSTSALRKLLSEPGALFVLSPESSEARLRPFLTLIGKAD
jgi:hypothetical protein